MATFTPPVTDGNALGDPDNPAIEHRLWRHYGAWAQGQTVWKDSLGVWHQNAYPYQGGGTTTVHDWDGTTTTTPDEGIDTAEVVYLGGHEHPIGEAGDADFDDLVAAGYRDFIVPANVLVGSDGTFEGGSLGAWVSAGNTTVSVTTAQAHSGSRSILAARHTSTGTIDARSGVAAGAGTFPVVVGETITAAVWLRGVGATNPIPNTRPVLSFYTSASAFVANIQGTLMGVPVGSWQFQTVTATVPATAAKAFLQVTGGNVAAGDGLYIDDVFIVRGSVPYDPASGWVD